MEMAYTTIMNRLQKLQNTPARVFVFNIIIPPSRIYSMNVVIMWVGTYTDENDFTLFLN